MPSARRGTTFAEILRSGVGGQSFDCREALGLLARLPKAHRFLHAQPAFGARTQQPFQARSAILPVELPPSPLPPPTFNCRCLYRQFAMKKTPLLTRGAAQSQVTHPNPAVEANFNPPPGMYRCGAIQALRHVQSPESPSLLADHRLLPSTVALWTPRQQHQHFRENFGHHLIRGSPGLIGGSRLPRSWATTPKSAAAQPARARISTCIANPLRIRGRVAAWRGVPIP